LIKVLHLLEIGGSVSIMSHFFNKLQAGKSHYIYLKKNKISSTVSRYYDGQSFDRFILLIISSFFKSFSYDIIHIHSEELLIPLFKLTGKKIALHYHGSDIRESNRSKKRIRSWCRDRADVIFYNGENMLDRIVTKKNIKKIYLPNPIDTDLFKSNIEKKHGNLILVSSNLDKEKTISEAKKLGPLDIIDLDIQQIPYYFMPKLLSKYEFYSDIKIMPYDPNIKHNLSNTALQALSCGCKVFHNGKEISKFPDQSKPETVVKNLLKTYEEILKN